MTISVEGLHAGDVICCVIGEDSAHTAMFVGNISKDGDTIPAIVHTDTTGTIYDSVDAIWEGSWEPEIFSCTVDGLGAKAAVYAQEWARWQDDDAADLTTYSDEVGGRSHAVMKGATPEFGYDALYRTVKWANRLSAIHEDMLEQAQLSQNRGTTCCAFVAACYQAAAINKFARGDGPKLREAEKFLKTFRGGKHPDRKKLVPSPAGTLNLDGGGIKMGMYDRAKRDLTNAGPKYKDGPFKLQDYLTVVLDALKPTPITKVNLTPEELFTPAMAVDAKFYYSNMLYANLKTSAGWTNHGPLEYVD